MSTQIFPQVVTTARPWGRGVFWNIEKTPVTSTTEQKTVTGRRAAIANYAFPLWHWKLTFSVLRDTMDTARNSAKASAKYAGYQEVVGFLMQRRGKAEPFFWRDPTDCTVTTQDIFATTPAGVKDYQMIRTFGNGATAFTAPVGGVDTSATNVVYVDGTPTGVTYNNPRDGWIHFGTAPTTGAIIRADFSYFWKVVLSKDGATFRTYAKDFFECVDFELDQVVL